MSTYIRDSITIWQREMIRLSRSKTRVVTSLAQPIFWLLLFGTAFNRMFGMAGGGLPAGVATTGIDFKSFLMPGIVAMTVLFGSIFSGIGIIFDREFGFLKEILVAPVARESIVAGKALGGSTMAIITGTMVLGLSTLIGAKFTPTLPPIVAALAAFTAVLLISLAFVTMGIAFASRIQSMEGFQMVMNFLVMPMFFVSGAFYPVQVMPGWLKSVTYINPMFYGVDALRNAFNGSDASFSGVSAVALPLWVDLLVLLGFTVLTTTIAVILFRKSE